MTFRALSEELERELRVRGYTDLRPAYGFVFQRLAASGAIGNELAEYLDVTKQASSQMIDELERLGYVERQVHPRSRREKLVILTPRGWGCNQAIEDIFAYIDLRYAGMLGAGRMQSFRVDLYRLALVINDGVIPTRLRPLW